jgi:very-short-patch-repair endonuclease
MCSCSPWHPERAITTKRKIEAFAAKAQGHRGRRNALRAARYIADGSGSIMESFAYMFLSIPSGLGGFGLSGATLNREILLKEDARERLKRKTAFVDLYYEAAKVAVEYQSVRHHSSDGQRGHDTLRQTALALQGVDVLQLSPYQVFDDALLRDFARLLSARLGKQLQLRSRNFEAMHGRLRALLESCAKRPDEALPIRPGTML